jgi:hypothetical protein
MLIQAMLLFGCWPVLHIIAPNYICIWRDDRCMTIHRNLPQQDTPATDANNGQLTPFIKNIQDNSNFPRAPESAKLLAKTIAKLSLAS